MNRRTLTALFALSALALTACTISPTAAPADPQPTVTVTAPAPEPEPEPAEPTRDTSSSSDAETVVMLLHASDPAFGTVPDSDIVKVTQAICEQLGNGHSARELGNLAMSSGFTQDQAAALVAAAIVVYCPWEEDNL